MKSGVWLRARRWIGRCFYLGEINDSQRQGWERCIEVFDEGRGRQERLALYPEDRSIPSHASEYGVQVRLREFALRRPRQWGACWAFIQMLDVHFPTTDGRELIFNRYTQPEPDQNILLAQLGWTLPPQMPPRITAKRDVAV